MTAADIIAFLRNHPKTCGVLGITLRTMGNRTWIEHDEMTLDGFYHPNGIKASKVRHWLGGLSTAKADEMRLGIGHNLDYTRFWFVTPDARDRSPNYPTRLAATFAAIEAALDKETTT